MSDDILTRLRASCDVREAALLRNLAADEIERLRGDLAETRIALANAECRERVAKARLAEATAAWYDRDTRLLAMEAQLEEAKAQIKFLETIKEREK